MVKVFENVGMFRNLRDLMANVREMGVVGTLRRRFGRKGPEFQILTAAGEEQITPTPETKPQVGGKREIRGI